MSRARKVASGSRSARPARQQPAAGPVGDSESADEDCFDPRAGSVGAEGDVLAQPQDVEWFWPRYRASQDRWQVVGAALKVLRTDRYLSAGEVADRAGMSRPYLTQIETGARRPPEQVVQRLLEAMGTGGGDLDLAAERTGMLIPERMREQMGLWTDEFGRVHRRAGHDDNGFPTPSLFIATSRAGQAPRASERLVDLLRIAAALDDREMELLIAYASGLARRPAPPPADGA